MEETGTMLDGAPADLRILLWQETKRALATWPDDPAIDTTWITYDGPPESVVLQLSRDEAEKIVAWEPMHEDYVDFLGEDRVH